MYHNNESGATGNSNQLGPNPNAQHMLFMSQTTTTTPSFQRRTLDGARQIRDNLNTVIREIQPLVDTARTVNGSISITNLLNRPPPQQQQHHDASTSTAAAAAASSDSFVINFENRLQEQAEEFEHQAQIFFNNFGGENGNNNNNADDGQNEHTHQPIAEAQQVLALVVKYLPFMLILFAKGLYDHREGIFNIIVLFAVFAHADNVVKKEATKRERRSFSKMGLALFYIVCCMAFIFYLFQDERLYLNLIFVRTYSKTLTVWDLLWFVTITDFILKLVTVAVKIFVTFMPNKLIAFQKRVNSIKKKKNTTY